ncbi:two-component system sensor histidine kinase YesM [Paenibacillus shirakamiensis]|uniref:Two-component system sensor histidine kinase YesM n=1 Tax=Paenibacillus shirakamiensis TaxID=1265935 RepID=A0ABS4JKJ2_9BACL|nr:sensor histidine kinase [Paenibacillus shirakamiensis]MBP2002238.1 two-component system sensor histidine kinase YesM [Paenibacillus shirakamiensis]
MKFRSIRTRLIQFMLLATTIPLSLSLIFTLVHTRESVKEQTVNENVRLMYQGKTNLVNYLNGINRASLSVYTDPHFLRNLALRPDDYSIISEIYTTLQTIQVTTPDIYQVYLHNNVTNISTLVTSSVPRREFRAKPYRNIQAFGSGMTAIQPVHALDSYGFPRSPSDYTDRNVFSLYRSIVNVPDSKQLALLAIDVKLDGINAICDQLYENRSEQLYLIDDKGTVIYSHEPNEIGKLIPDHAFMKALKNDDEGYFDDKDAMSIYEKLNLGFASWTLVKQIPHTSLYQQSTQLVLINGAIAILALLAVVLVTLWISIRITKPIKQLTHYINVVQTGQLDVDIQVTSPDEIGILSRRFRQMMDTINNLILREYRLELANKTNQLKALQAQINPHFLYNTLQSIGTLALQHNVPRVYSLLSSLSNIMRYNMRSSEALVTLKDEVNHLKLYLELQKERFGDQLEVKWEIDEDSLSFSVPKMILQPIAENYFKHGMGHYAGVGCLSITTRAIDEHRVTIIIENNGSSLEEEALSKLQEKLGKTARQLELTEDDNSIGLSNVLMRLQLYSDNLSTLTISNLSPHGIQITLDIIALGRETE